MIGSLSLPAIAFLAAVTGLPGLPRLRGLPTPASKEDARAIAGAHAELARSRRPRAQRLRLGEHPALGHLELDEPEARAARPAAEPVPLARHAAGPRHPARGPALGPGQGEPAPELGEPGA